MCQLWQYMQLLMLFSYTWRSSRPWKICMWNEKNISVNLETRNNYKLLLGGIDMWFCGGVFITGNIIMNYAHNSWDNRLLLGDIDV